MNEIEGRLLRGETVANPNHFEYDISSDGTFSVRCLCCLVWFRRALVTFSSLVYASLLHSRNCEALGYRTSERRAKPH